MKIINGYIDVDKIDKSLIVKARSGKRFLNLTIVVKDSKNQYDQDVDIAHQTAKGEPKKFLGNGKVVFTNEYSQRDGVNYTRPEQQDENESNRNNELPF